MNINTQLAIINAESIIGRMINHDDIRKQYCSIIEENPNFSENMNLLICCLKEEEFSLENILKKYGRPLVIYAINLAQESMKLELKWKYQKKME